MKLVFIRHGDPDYVNDSLTEKGFREAECLRKRVEKWDIKEIYCSPLGRAQATAKPFLTSMNREAITCDWLKEFYVKIKDPITGNDKIPWDFMPQYFTKQEMLYNKDTWTSAPVMMTGDVKAACEDVWKNFDELLKGYGYVRDGGLYRVEKHSDDTLVFVCHLGVTFLIVSHLLGIAAPLLWQGFFMPPTSLVVLNSEERIEGEAYFRCQAFSDTRHLTDNGEPVSPSGYFTELFRG